MEVGEGEGEEMGEIGSSRPRWVVGRRLGGSSRLGMRVAWLRPHLVCTLDCGGPGINIPFPPPRFKSRD